MDEDDLPRQQTWDDLWRAQRRPLLPWLGGRPAAGGGPIGGAPAGGGRPIIERPPAPPAGRPAGRGVACAGIAAGSLLLCLCLLPMLIISSHTHQQLLRNGVVTQATVIGRPGPDACGGRTCRYVRIRYATPAGPQTATVPSPRRERFPPGATVTIRYDPANPTKLERVDDTDQQYFTFMVGFSGGIGLLFLLLAIIRAAT